MTTLVWKSAATFRLTLREKLAFVLLNQVDLLLTYFAVSIGFSELNPFMRDLLATPWQLLSIKVAAPLLIAWLVPGKFLLPAIGLLCCIVGWDVKELVIGLI